MMRGSTIKDGFKPPKNWNNKPISGACIDIHCNQWKPEIRDTTHGRFHWDVKTSGCNECMCIPMARYERPSTPQYASSNRTCIPNNREIYSKRYDDYQFIID
jgi:hypothetical protein